MTDTTRLSAPLMAERMHEALRRRGVDVDLGVAGWRMLLEGIAEGIIDHLSEHEQALEIQRHTSTEVEHDHGNHVQVRK